MRVSTVQMQRQSVDSMLDMQAKLAHTQEQVATGKRVLSPSDDPSATAHIVELEQEIAVTERYQANAESAVSQLGHVDGLLGSVTNILHRVQELAVQGNNDTLSAVDRSVIAQEIYQRAEELLGIANSRDARGDYVFAGFQSDTPPFSHDGVGHYLNAGDQGRRHAQIGHSTQVAVNDSGARVFEQIRTDNGEHQSVLETVHALADTLANASDDDVGRAQLHDHVNQTLANLDNALDNVNEVRATVGARLNVVESQQNNNEGFLYLTREALSGVQDLDYAEAITRLNMQLTGLQAAQQAYLKIQGLSLFKLMG